VLGAHGRNDATRLANIRVDLGFRVSFVHHGPPNPPASLNPPRKIGRYGVRELPG